MENIYKPSEFFCTELIDVEKHFSDFSKLVLETDLGSPNLKDNVAHLLGDIKRGTLNDLQNACRFEFFFKLTSNHAGIFSIDKLKCPKEVQPVEQPDTILSQHRLTLTCPVTSASKQNLRTIEEREKFKEDPHNYAKYRHEVRHEFETNIMVHKNSINYDLHSCYHEFFVETRWLIKTFYVETK